MPPLARALAAEAIGTFAIVLAGCGEFVRGDPGQRGELSLERSTQAANQEATR
jgi:glycerol uptake facilitator-like aquaporin